METFAEKSAYTFANRRVANTGMVTVSLGLGSPWQIVTFVELQKSIKYAGLIPKIFVLWEVEKDANVWPDIGVRQAMPTLQ